MKICVELARTITPAYSPCANFTGACAGMRWAPEQGHVPRGFLGATGSISEVELVLVFSEPGDPHSREAHCGLESTLGHTYESMKNGTDQFHRNVRLILDLCFPDVSGNFDKQLAMVWMTESVLCSAAEEGGEVPSIVWRTCVRDYLKPQLELFPHALIVALGSKARTRIKDLGFPFLDAVAAAPPGCNRKHARPSWEAVAEEVRRRRQGRS